MTATTDSLPLALPAPAAARPRWGHRVAALFLSILMALGIAEAVATVMHDGAWPFLNIYEPDPRYGVRLEADTTTRTRSRLGRVTEVRTNALGFRGEDWPEPAPEAGVAAGRVLLLGDSQVFGYGVDEEQALGAELGRSLGSGWEVLNAGVPTWGPEEQALAGEDLVPSYRPAWVVFMVNLANDWQEAKLANVARTGAKDGWATHLLGKPPEEPSWFPFRRWFMGKSHLVYAVRHLHAAAGPPPAPAVSAERLMKDMRHLVKPDGPHRSRITKHLARVIEVCRAQGCRVLVATLPLDVQVSETEWTKYQGKPIPVMALRRLTRDVRLDAADLGARTTDLLPPLEAASPGAFLPDDYHLSPKGHATVAGTLAQSLRETP
jgi:hypothetical protein